jgi:hypothetical protein
MGASDAQGTFTYLNILTLMSNPGRKGKIHSRALPFTFTTLLIFGVQSARQLTHTRRNFRRFCGIAFATSILARAPPWRMHVG